MRPQNPILAVADEEHHAAFGSYLLELAAGRHHHKLALQFRKNHTAFVLNHYSYGFPKFDGDGLSVLAERSN